MKRKLILACLIVFSFCTFLLTACSKHTHAYGDWVTVLEPTCINIGVKECTCSCGEKETEIIPATGIHTFQEWTIAVEPNCITGGLKERTCSCGEKETETIPATDIHNFVNGYCSGCSLRQPITEGLEYTLSHDGTSYTCAGIGTATTTDIIVIADYIDGKPVTSIGQCAFYECTSLQGVVIPDSVTVIEFRAFAYCVFLQSVVIPDSVTIIDVEAFYKCTSLQSVTIGDSVTTIGGGAFQECTVLQSIEIPDSVTTIGDWAFYMCSSLQNVTIGKNVTSINNNTFFMCTALQSIEIPDSVTTIDGGAFYMCASLQYNIYNNAKYLGNDNNSHLFLIESINDEIIYCEIHSSAKIIANSAFYENDSLTSIVIPDSVTNIEDYAFSDCDSLENVYYKGTVSDWNSISIGSSNSYLTNATKYYYSETEPTDTVNNYWRYVDGVPTAW